MTDGEIIELFFSRSEEALSALAERHGKAVGKVAVNILGNLHDAEECINDTWLGVWNSIPPQRPEHLGSYVCRVARNLALKQYHSGKALKRNSQYDIALEELGECVAARDDVEAEYAAHMLSESINTFLGALSYEDRFVFVRRYWYSDSLMDIAKMTGMSYNSLSQRLHRLRSRLRKHLDEEV